MSGALGAQKVLAAPADGHMLYQGSPNDLILTPMALQAVKYKSEDFRMVQIIGAFPMAVLARKELGANNIDELAALAKKAAEGKPLPKAERRALLKRGLAVLERLQQRGRLTPDKQTWPEMFRQALQKLAP